MAEGNQLDLFCDDAPNRALRRLRDALVGHEPQAAAQRLTELVAVDCEHPSLPAAKRLTAALREIDEPVADASIELNALYEGELNRASTSLLGQRSQHYLTPFWRRLARALPNEWFDPERPWLHPSWVAAQYNGWKEVIDAVEAVSNHRRQAVLLRRLIDARLAIGEWTRALRDLCDLCWDYPADAEQWLEHTETSILIETAEYLWNLDSALTAAWFPAALLIVRPGLAYCLQARPRAEQGAPAESYRVVHDLVTSRDDGATRARLRKLSPSLLEAWLQREIGA